MTNEKLDTIFKSVTDSIKGQAGNWQFKINETMFVCVTDTSHNRMRIISPIIESFKLSEELKTDALVANFHSVLDVKYAISNDILWAVFIHPLKELTDEQVKDAIKQVYFANVTFGTTYTSTSLIFPGKENDEEPTIKEEPSF